MSDEAAVPVEQKAPETSQTGAPAAASPNPAPAADVKMEDAPVPATAAAEKPTAGKDSAVKKEAEKSAATADVDMKDATAASAEKAPETAAKAEETETKPDVQPAESEDKPASNEKTAEADPDASAAAPAIDATPVNKNRRKSGVASTGKKLNKKQSKAKMVHLDAQPGDHFFAKLKGFPPWPVIVCDEDMLPSNMLNSRPVTAARPDGTYRDDYADGGKKTSDRTYPVMYLQTNEFSWTRNTDLEDLDPSVVQDLVTPKMRKDLAQAHVLASEQKDINHYKQVLRDFQEQKIADAEAKAAKARAKKEKGSKKSAAKVDDDVEMADVDAEEGEESETKKASKKRKAEEDANAPQRSDSVKKPKIKLTTSSTPKAAANGVGSPKEAAVKASKAKAKTSKTAKDADGEKPKKEAPKEPELTPEEKHARKEKEILFLRHRLQKGLLTREAQIKESDMPGMSDYLAKLEGFPDLEVGIIKKTKINKVLKAMLKIAEIPKESEFNFKPRSSTLLDKWTKILAAESDTPATTTNGVNGTPGNASASKETTNGVNGEKESSKEPTKETAKEDSAADKEEAKEAPKPEAESETNEEKAAPEAKPATESAAVETAA